MNVNLIFRAFATQRAGLGSYAVGCTLLGSMMDLCEPLDYRLRY
jgi:hypothetical protein